MTITTEEAQRLAARLSLDAEAQQAARYQPYTDHAMRDAAATIRSLAAERDAMKAENAILQARITRLKIGASVAKDLIGEDKDNAAFAVLCGIGEET